MIFETIQRLMSVGDIPEPTPPDPFPLLVRWLDDARQSNHYADPNAMALATATPDGVPSVRIVLCKAIDAAEHSLKFFTNYESRKGGELAANPRAAVVFHWPHAGRQARVEGEIERLPESESDAYFKSRPLISRVGAIVSRQSAVIRSRADLLAEAAKVAGASLVEAKLERPPYWGGFRLRASSVELWCNCEGRLHQRVRWRRATLAEPAAWTSELLSP